MWVCRLASPCPSHVFFWEQSRKKLHSFLNAERIHRTNSRIHSIYGFLEMGYLTSVHCQNVNVDRVVGLLIFLWRLQNHRNSDIELPSGLCCTVKICISTIGLCVLNTPPLVYMAKLYPVMISGSWNICCSHHWPHPPLPVFRERLFSPLPLNLFFLHSLPAFRFLFLLSHSHDWDQKHHFPWSLLQRLKQGWENT